VTFLDIAHSNALVYRTGMVISKVFLGALLTDYEKNYHVSEWPRFLKDKSTF